MSERSDNLQGTAMLPWPALSTVPATCAAMLGVAGAAEHAVVVGDRVEVDLDALAACDRQAAMGIWEYFQQAKEFWAALADGVTAGSYVVVRRPLLRARQRDGRQGRVDLTGELAALEQMPATAAVTDALLGADTDWVAIEAADGRVTRDGDKAKVACDIAAPVWDRRLGGSPTPGELKRTVTLESNHAKWRDRKVRRLVAVDVDVDEIWPAPSTSPA